MKFKNFKIWRGKLPHWRADDVLYYVTFRHKRPFDEVERSHLFRSLLTIDGKKWSLLVLCVLPEATEMMLVLNDNQSELSKIIEKAKGSADKKIRKKTNERFPVLYEESYDRIVRDDTEREERFMAILESPQATGLLDESDEFETLYYSLTQ